MKDKDVLAFIPIFIVGFVLGVAFVMFLSIFAFNKVEQTKRTAERNGVGG